MADRQVHEAPPSHSRASHRVHGWCWHCREHTPYKEITAWRTRENATHEARDTTATGAHVTTRAKPEQPCPTCGEETLAVVTVTVLLNKAERPIGGWALCSSCEATPHPLLEVADHG